MKYELINKSSKKFSTIQQILYNRGINKEEIFHYMNLTQQDIYDYKLLGKENLKKGLKILIKTIQLNKQALLIIDPDCDGYTASALFVNYLYKLFPSWIENKLFFYFHDSKQHGLKDCINYIKNNEYFLIICPDSASNDYEQHKQIKQYGGNILILDHHLAQKISQDAIVINNQLSNYPNKMLSGVGIVWQFCRYIDNIIRKKYSNQFLDLVALGLTADMVSLKQNQTRYLITKGFKKQYIKNPFIKYMIDKNSFPLSKSDYVSNNLKMACTSIGAAFFIVPFVNAITRSGTLKEKELLFNSMLNHKAYQKILSNKRGHKLGEQQLLILQAIRTVTNVKNRQTREEEKGLEKLENLIKKNNMLKNKVLVFLLQQNSIPSEIRGLIANKLASKYMRPCCILTKTNHNTYQGSTRGYTKTGIESFKEILQSCSQVQYVQGHNNANGCGINAETAHTFNNTLNQKLKNISNQSIYKIDYDFKENENNNQIILDIASMNDYWGQDIDRPYVNINFKITNSNFQIMKNNTFKFILPNNLSVIKFKGTEDEIDKFTVQPNKFKEVNAICKCNQNFWNNQIYPQLIIEDIEIIDEGYYF